MTRSAIALGLCLLATQAMADDTNSMVIRPEAPLSVYLAMARGQGLLDTGDLTGARRLLAVGAAAGIPSAARSMAQSYDPVWLVKHGAMGIDWLADPEKAISWYQIAADLGDDYSAHYLLNWTEK